MGERLNQGRKITLNIKETMKVKKHRRISRNARPGFKRVPDQSCFSFMVQDPSTVII
jgi:hypothetical protein